MVRGTLANMDDGHNFVQALKEDKVQRHNAGLPGSKTFMRSCAVEFKLSQLMILATVSWLTKLATTDDSCEK